MNFFDLHCDTATVCVDGGAGLRGETMISLDKRADIERWVEVFAIWLPSGQPDEAARQAYLRYVCAFRSLLETERGAAALCRTDGEIDRAHAQGQCAALLAIENGAALGGRLESVEEAAADGVKFITLTWNGENALGFGSDLGGRLKPFGRQAALEMFRRGIVPDISHLSDEGVDDLLCLSDAPVVATHSNLKKICGHCRNLNDTFFKEIARRGGLVGINLYTKFLRDGGGAGWDDLFRHLDAMLELGGEDAVAFGSDFDGAEMPDFCRDLRDIPAVYARCAARYGASQADKLFYGNARAFVRRAFLT